ncbi:MAG TPA: hypothetical protein VEE84_05445 [Burkholderiaceae bacterium]|nr:hypothetical protein [Burkholderiaceae bacterium]
MASTDAAASAVAALAQCLEDEYRALLAENLEQLAAVLGRKERLLAELASHCTALGAAQSDGGRASSQWAKALMRVRAMNQRNALVLAPRSAAIRARLRFLQAAVGRDAVYRADGSLGAGRLRAGQGQNA